MADSIKTKKLNPISDFNDDLDEMLDTESITATKQVGEIDDEDAIDRLLMGDNFQHQHDENETDEFADIDLILDETEGDKKNPAIELDDFDDLFIEAGRPSSSSGKTEQEINEVDDFLDISDDDKQVENIDEVTLPELDALEQVADIDEFADDFADIVPVSKQPAVPANEVLNENSSNDLNSGDDFLLSDFDISAEEVIPDSLKTEEIPQKPVRQIDEDQFAGQPAIKDAVPVIEPIPESTEEAVDSAEELITTEQSAPVTQDSNIEALAIPEITNLIADVKAAENLAKNHRAELDELATKILVVKKQLLVIKQEMTEKAAKDELIKILDEVDNLHVEQKKSKRTLTALAEKKPVVAYVASGLAVMAIFVAVGVGYQGFISSSQLGELTQIIGKMQQEAGTAPSSDAADKEILRKQLNELSVAQSVTASQIAEINKTLQGNAGVPKSGGDINKKIDDLNSQSLQMGETIENLQKKLNTLEKTKVVAVLPVAKPEKKKPVEEENWVVNLVAFKQDWYAKRKADEYAGKGVPAKVTRAESKGETWYRLSVDGFKSQYEAAGYAARVKKNLNLDSVWVAHNKE